jgi:hypothetical protein
MSDPDLKTQLQEILEDYASKCQCVLALEDSEAKDQFLNCIKEFSGMVMEKFDSERQEQNLDELEKELETITMSIAALKINLNQRKFELHKNLGAKQEIVKKFEKKSEQNEDKFQDHEEQRREEFHSLNNKSCRKRWEHIQQLKKEIEKAQVKYKAIVQENFREEQDLKELKLKTEKTLQTVLERFDNDVGGRSMEIKKLKEYILKTEDEWTEWHESTFMEQEMKYEETLNCIENDKQQAIRNFNLKRAATIIQKHWRKILKIRRKKEKKMKKLMDKKKQKDDSWP